MRFLSHPEGVEFASPLRHVDGIDDVSHLRKWEIRGDTSSLRLGDGDELIRISPDRALLVGERRPDGARVYDMTAALAAFEVEGEDLMRRLTELDLDELIERRGGERFRLYVPQELGHFVAETVVDMARGLGR